MHNGECSAVHHSSISNVKTNQNGLNSALQHITNLLGVFLHLAINIAGILVSLTRRNSGEVHSIITLGMNERVFISRKHEVTQRVAYHEAS